LISCIQFVIISLMSEFLRALGETYYPNRTIVVTVDSPGRHTPLQTYAMSPVETTLLEAVRAEQNGNKNAARRLYLEAGYRAQNAFESARNPVTAVERKSWSQYGLLAVISFLQAGDREMAVELGQRLSANPLVRTDTKTRIGELIGVNPTA